MNNLLIKYKKHFPDISSLYDYQEDVLNLLEKQNDTLAIVPTGGGKSLIYQLMSLDLEGITIVIQPLVALMKEQVDELNDKRKISALALNSSLSFLDQRKILRNMGENYKLIYMSPERLQNSFFRAALLASGVKISMVAVDEAHCISQWGSSFRPDYGQIAKFIAFLRVNGHSPVTLCLTATLAKLPRIDIVSEFGIKAENVIVKDIIRTNLNLNFEKVKEENQKSKILKDFLERHQPKKTIAYLYSRPKCEEYAAEFRLLYKTDFFYSDSEGKEEAYENFLNNKIDILFATTAFGMGINIPDIDCVAQLQIPNSVEEYYQQVGRGWRKRDVKKNCQCLAIWSEVNFDRRIKKAERQKVSLTELKTAYKQLLGGTKIKLVGQIINKDKDALLNSSYNLQLLRYKLEKYGCLKTIAEVNGSPLTIEFNKDTDLWNKVREAASTEDGVDSFVYVSKVLSIPIVEIINHLFEQDLNDNIKKLPAMKRDVYFEVLTIELPDTIAKSIADEINQEVDFRITRLNELQDLFTCENKEQKLFDLLS